MSQKTILLWYRWFRHGFSALLMGGFGGLIVAVIIATGHHAPLGFNQLNTVINEEKNYLMIMSTPAAWTISHWLQQIPTTLTPTTMHLPLMHSQYGLQCWLMILPIMKATLLGTQLLLIHFYLLWHWLSLFLLLGLVGLIDGLAQRTIRRVAVGRENASMHHQARSYAMFIISLGILFSLDLPLPVMTMQWVIVIMACFFGMAIQVSAKQFKKYV